LKEVETMMGFGWQELLIVLVIVMIIFGAGKLPQVGRSLGLGVKEFKAEADGGRSIAADTVAKDDGRVLGSREVRAERI
jgi:sec-independent protein translocase protein TatA